MFAVHSLLGHEEPLEKTFENFIQLDVGGKWEIQTKS